MIEIYADSNRILRLCGEATIHHATVLHQLLSEQLNREQAPVALDLAQMTALDTAGAQILIAFKRAVPGLSVHSCPERIRQFAERTGLEALLF